MPSRASDWHLSEAEAETARNMPALEILTGGIAHVNRIVDLGGPFGKVIDRTPIRQAGSTSRRPPIPIPRPHVEAEIIRSLNEAGADFVPKIHFADERGLLLEYVEGETHSLDQWLADPELRASYTEHYPRILGKLAELTPRIAVPPLRAAERGCWPDRVRTAAEFGRAIPEVIRTDRARMTAGPDKALLEKFGSMADIDQRLAEFKITGSRPTYFQHNDFHTRNTVLRPPDRSHGERPEALVVIDWEFGGSADVWWDVACQEWQFEQGPEREKYLANVRDSLPREALDGADHDLEQYRVLRHQRDRLFWAGNFLDDAYTVFREHSGTTTEEEKHLAIAPILKKLQRFSAGFAEKKKCDYSEDEILKIVIDHHAGLEGASTSARGLHMDVVIDLASRGTRKQAATPGQAAGNSARIESRAKGPSLERGLGLGE